MKKKASSCTARGAADFQTGAAATHEKSCKVGASANEAGDSASGGGGGVEEEHARPTEKKARRSFTNIYKYRALLMHASLLADGNEAPTATAAKWAEIGRAHV